jgi:hypothetical protein
MARRSFCFVLLALVAGTAPAQRVTAPVFSPPTNAVVRAWQANRLASPRSYWGRLVSIDSESVVIQSSQLGRPITLGLDSVARLEYSTVRESKTRNMLLGAGVGSVIGAPLFIGAMVVLAGLSDSPNHLGAGDFILVGAIGGLAGAGAGSMIGAMFPGRRIWEPLPLRPRS